MLCSGWNVVAQSAGNCVAMVLVRVDGSDNEHCSFSWSVFLIRLPLFCLLPGLSPVRSAREGCCDPSGRREGRALGTPRCRVGAGSHSTIALQLHLVVCRVPKCAEPLSVGCWCTVQCVGQRAAPVHLA